MGPSIYKDPINITRDDKYPFINNRRYSLSLFNLFGYKTSPALPSLDKFVYFRVTKVINSTNNNNSIIITSSRLFLSRGGIILSVYTLYTIRSNEGDGKEENIKILKNIFNKFRFK